MIKTKSIVSISKYVKISPYKARRVLDYIRGKSCNEVLYALKIIPYKARFPLCKIVNSAMSNAQNNFNLDKNELIITEAYVNEGPKFKRVKFRARGMSNTVIKKTCHITVRVDEIK